MPGYEVHILDKTGNRQRENTFCAIAIKLPLLPSTLQTLWNAEERFQSSYLTNFPGYYDTGDAGIFDEDGYL